MDMYIPELIEFPKIGDSTLGYISVAECNKNIPFEIKRVYWTYYTPQDVIRGGHAHKELHQLIFAICGIIIFKVEDRTGNKYTFELNKPNIGLKLYPYTWREIQFSHNAVLLCMASDVYKEEDYIRHYNEFKDGINNR